MKNYLILTGLLACSLLLKAQSYFGGQVVTSYGQRLPSVRIISVKTGQSYKSDPYGNFGFYNALAEDSLLFYCDGYDTLVQKVMAEDYVRAVLQPLPSSVILKSHPSSVLLLHSSIAADKNIREETYQHTEAYLLQQTAVSPGIAFSANINRASYSNIRRLINEMEYLLPPQAVRIEEMLNYFNFNYQEPEKDSVFKPGSLLSSCPWDKSHELLFLNISARRINFDTMPPNNLVFLMDASGSMDMPNKLPLLKNGFIGLLKNLRPVDTVSLITFGGTVNLLAEGLSGNQRDSLIHLIEQINADGPTPGEAAIKMAIQVARRRLIRNGNNRIILAADGDFNVGASSEKDLMSLIEREKHKGIYLTCIGVGSGNYKDSKLAILAQKGNGNLAYIDNEQEAERVLVTDITRTLFAVADNVYLSVLFNSSRVKAYRLLGYENEQTGFKNGNVRLRGGEIGSGHSLMAVFEIVPTEDTSSAKVADIQLHYRKPRQAMEYILNYTSRNKKIPFKTLNTATRQAAAVVMFGMKLKEGALADLISWRLLQKTAAACFDKKDYQDKELLQLIAKAKKMYTHPKKYGGD